MHLTDQSRQRLRSAEAFMLVALLVAGSVAFTARSADPLPSEMDAPTIDELQFGPTAPEAYKEITGQAADIKAPGMGTATSQWPMESVTDAFCFNTLDRNKFQNPNNPGDEDSALTLKEIAAITGEDASTPIGGSAYRSEDLYTIAKDTPMTPMQVLSLQQSITATVSETKGNCQTEVATAVATAQSRDAALVDKVTKQAADQAAKEAVGDRIRNEQATEAIHAFTKEYNMENGNYVPGTVPADVQNAKDRADEKQEAAKTSKSVGAIEQDERKAKEKSINAIRAFFDGERKNPLFAMAFMMGNKLNKDELVDFFITAGGAGLGPTVATEELEAGFNEAIGAEQEAIDMTVEKLKEEGKLFNLDAYSSYFSEFIKLFQEQIDGALEPSPDDKLAELLCNLLDNPEARPALKTAVVNYIRDTYAGVNKTPIPPQPLIIPESERLKYVDDNDVPIPIFIDATHTLDFYVRGNEVLRRDVYDLKVLDVANTFATDAKLDCANNEFLGSQMALIIEAAQAAGLLPTLAELETKEPTGGGGEEEGPAGAPKTIDGGSFTSTVGNEVKRIAIPAEVGTTYSKVIVDIDLTVGPFDPDCGTFSPKCYNNVFWMQRGEKWGTDNIGFAIILGPESKQLKLTTSISGDQKSNKSANFSTGSTYHVHYEIGAGNATLNVGGISTGYSIGTDRILMKKGAFIELGQVRGIGPEVATIGWKYDNVKVQLIP